MSFGRKIKSVLNSFPGGRLLFARYKKPKSKQINLANAIQKTAESFIDSQITEEEITDISQNTLYGCPMIKEKKNRVPEEGYEKIDDDEVRKLIDEAKNKINEKY